MNIKSQILKQIKEKHDNAIRLADNNLKIALKNASFKNLFTEYKSLNFDISKSEFNNNDTSLLQKDLKKNIKQIKQCIKELGFTKQDFYPNFTCKKCNDSGYIDNKLCECYYNLLNKELSKNLNCTINKNHSFKTSKPEIFLDTEAYKKIYSKLETWCNKFPSSKYKNIVLMGSTGVGKTFLAECIGNKLIDKNFLVGFYSSFALNNLFLKFHTTFDESKSSMLDGVLNCEVLIIDDLGSEQTYSNVTSEYLYLVINERLNSNKSTIITTNCNPNEILDLYGERNFSRICNKNTSLMIKLENKKDIRTKRI